MRVGKADGSSWLRLNDAAELLGVSHTTLRRWSDTGRLTCYRSPGGHRRYRRSDLTAALATHCETIPAGAADVRRPHRRGESDEAHVLAARSAKGALATLARVAAEGVGADEALIAFVDGRHLEFLAGHSTRGAVDGRLGTRCTLDDAPPAAIALSSRRRLVIADLGTTTVLSPREIDLCRRAGRAALLVVPISVHGRPAGVLQLATAEAPHAFTGANVTFAEFVARQAASLVTEACGGDEPAGAATADQAMTGGSADDLGLRRQEGAGEAPAFTLSTSAPARSTDEAQGASSREFAERLRRHNRELDLIVRAGLTDISGLRPREALRSIARRLSELTQTPVVDLYAVDGPIMRALTSFDGGRFDDDWEDVTLPLSRYPCSMRAVETCEITVAARLADAFLSDQDRYSLEKWGYQAQLSMPLIAEGRVIGLLELSDYTPRDFAQDLELIRGLGAAATQAVQTITLLGQAERHDHIFRELVALGTWASTERDPQKVFARAAERIIATVDAADCEIFGLQEETFTCLASHDRSGPDASSTGRRFHIERYPALKDSVRAGEPFILTSIQDARLTEEERRLYREHGTASEMCVPLMAGERLFGLIDIYDTRERDYGEYLDFLLTMANGLAGRMASEARLEDLKRRACVLEDLAGMMALAGDSDTPQTLLVMVATRLREALGMTRCDIYRLRGDRLSCSASVREDGPDESAFGFEFGIDEFPATAMTVRTGRPLAIGRLDEDARLTAHEREHYAEQGFLSEVCLPLTVDGRVTGVIDLFDRRPRDAAALLQSLEPVAEFVARALAQAVRVERTERRTSSLAELAELVAGASTVGGAARLAHTIAEYVTAQVDARGCRLFKLHGDSLEQIVAEGVDRHDPGQALDLGLLPTIGAAIRRRESLVVATSDDPSSSACEPRLFGDAVPTSHVCVPLVARDRLVGLLDVIDRPCRDWRGSLELLERAGAVAAGALENALLLDALEESNRQLALLSDVGFELSSSLRLDDVLYLTASRLCEVARASRCDIHRVDDDALVLVASVSDGRSETKEIGRRTSLGDRPAAGEAVATSAPVLTESPDHALLGASQRRVLHELGETRLLTAPLVSKGRVIGVIELIGGERRRGLLPDETDAVEAICRVAALAIDNADLVRDLERRGRETALLNEIATSSGASLDLSKISAASLGTLRQLISFERGTITALGEDGRYECAYTTGDETGPDGLDHDIDTPEDLRERALRERLVAFDLPRAKGGAAGFTSVLMAALVADDELVGTLRLETSGPDAFTGEDRSLLDRVATQLALAIKNAALYARVTEVHHSNLRALSGALNAKDYYTLGHAARVAAYTALLARELGWDHDFLRRVEEAAYLHDIGKIAVSDRVLLKPSRLNPHEWELMRQHPIFSSQIIQPLFEEDLVAGVRHHHERYDGTGYPDGLSGDDIPLLARVMCVVDSYDAMSLRRPYRSAHSYDECVEELRRCAGTHFDPAVVAAFLRVLAGLEEKRERTRAAARDAAALVDPVLHETLRTPEDEDTPAYVRAVAALRGVRDAHPPARFVTTLALRGGRVVIVADAEEPDSPERSRVGDEVPFDDDLDAAFSGRSLDSNTLYVDQFGVWVSAVEPIRRPDGTTVAVASVDMPVETNGDMEDLRGEVSRAFASMLASGAGHVVRAELEVVIDSLTGLYSHRHFHERLGDEIERCMQRHGRLAVLLLDLDDFRSFNDRHGHSAGDSALRAVARIVESSLGVGDLAARFGGQEFATILLDADEAAASGVADHIRRGIRDAAFAGGDPLSVSIGIALWPTDAQTKDQLLDKAEQALRCAKDLRDEAALTATAGGLDHSLAVAPGVDPD
jgi:diguanylate cyclase (GGDEF)-like protein/excisionase family DNA binding protein